MRTPRGRVATDAAWQHLNLEPRKQKDSPISNELFAELEE